jgi:hypothetical protein
MAALQELVSKVNVSCGEEPGPAKVHELPKPEQKTAAKKTAATGLTRYGRAEHRVEWQAYGVHRSLWQAGPGDGSGRHLRRQPSRQPRVGAAGPRPFTHPLTGGPRRRRPAKLHGDKGYEYAHLRQWLANAVSPRIARKGLESSQRLGRHRWVVERIVSWLLRFSLRGDVVVAGGCIPVSCGIPMGAA